MIQIAPPGTNINKRPLTAKRAAIDLIRSYVLAGRTLEQFKEGELGYFGPDYHASIGGYINRKRISTDYILVEQLNGRPYTKTFLLKDIITAVRRGAK